MADDKELALDKASKKKKIIIIIAVVLLLAVAGGAAMFFMGGDSASQAELDAELDSGEVQSVAAAAAPANVEVGSALYVPMPRAFRFNVPGTVRDRFVEIRVQLLVRGSNNEETAKKHVPLLESSLLGVFSQANADDLATSAGKVSLKQKSLAEVQKIMMEISGERVIDQVLFTGFVMQ
jgi:flagellar FliL protein